MHQLCKLPYAECQCHAVLPYTHFSGVTYISLTSPRSMLPYTAATSSLELRLVSDAARTPRAVRDSTWSRGEW